MRPPRLARAIPVVACLLGACASAPKAVFPPVEYEGFAGTLPSGIRILVYQLPDMRTFSLDASYALGALDDPPGKEGLALLAGRVISRRGGVPREGRSFAARLLAAGVRFDSIGGADAIEFSARGTPDRLSAVLSIEEERLRDPLAGVTEGDLHEEVDGLVRELSDPARPIGEGTELQWLVDAALPPGPYRRPPRGTPRSLRSISLEDLRSFCKAHFTPDRLILAVIGPHPPRETAMLAHRIFGPLAPGSGRAVQPWTRPPVAQGLMEPVSSEILVQRSPVAPTHLWLGWIVPGDVARFAAAAGIARVEVSRAMERAFPEMPLLELVKRITVRLHATDGFALVAARVALQAEDEAAKIVTGLRKTDEADASLSRRIGKAAIRSWQITDYFALERPDASRLARLARATPRADVLAVWKNAVVSQLSEGVDAYARRWLDPRRAVPLLVAPEPGRLDVGSPEPPGAREVWGIAQLDEPKLPPGSYDVLALARPPGLDAAVRRRLPNGLEVVVLRWPGFPKVEARLVVRTDPPGTPEVPLDLPQLALDASRRNFRGFQIWNRAPARFSADHVLVAGTVMSGGTEGLLESLACWAEELAIDDDLFDRLKMFRRGGSLDRSTSAAILTRGLLVRIFPSEQWTRAFEADSAELTSGRAQRWLSSTLRPDRATLILAGDLRPEPALFSRIEELFGPWRVWRDEPPASMPPPGAALRSPVLLAGQPKARRAWIMGAAAVAPGVSLDSAAFAAVVGEMKWDLGRDGAWEAVASPTVRLYRTSLGAMLLVIASVPTEQVASAVRRIMEAFDAASLVAPSAGMVAALRWSLAREFTLAFETGSQAVDALTKLAVGNHRSDYWERYPAIIDSLSPGRVQAAAAGLDGRVIGVLGDVDAVLPRLKEAGLQVEVLPAPPAGKP